jgi:putative transposase
VKLDCAYRYRCYPKTAQQRELARTFGSARFVYNWALRMRTDAFYERGERISYVQSSAALTALKKREGQEWMHEVSSVPMQQALRHLDTAYRNFFAGRAKYPTFHTKHGAQSAEYTTSAFRFRDGQLTLAKMDAPLPIRWSRPLPQGAKPTTVTISRDAAGRYFVSLRITQQVAPLTPTESAIGIDVGISSLVTLSSGEKIGNPRHTQRDARRLARAQKKFARTQKGSRRREKARTRVARIHARIADRRQDALHKLTTRLIRENQTLVVESLAVKHMVRNRSLAKHISDAAWGELVRQLRYKATWYGRELIEIDRWYPSSKRCFDCGHVATSLPLDIRSWACPDCGVIHDRDVNAAKNILAVGQTVNARGEGIRPKRFTVAAPFAEPRISVL